MCCAVGLRITEFVVAVEKEFIAREHESAFLLVLLAHCQTSRMHDDRLFAFFSHVIDRIGRWFAPDDRFSRIRESIKLSHELFAPVLVLRLAKRMEMNGNGVDVELERFYDTVPPFREQTADDAS